MDGSELLLLAAGCNAFIVGVSLGIEEDVGLSIVSPSIGPAPLLDFFFFVIICGNFLICLCLCLRTV